MVKLIPDLTPLLARPVIGTDVPMASTAPNNDLQQALQPDVESTGSSKSVFSKRVLLVALLIGVVCAVEIGHRIMYNQDYDGDGHISAGEMTSCIAGFFTSCGKVDFDCPCNGGCPCDFNGDWDHGGR